MTPARQQVDAALPLILLRSVRLQDTPDELLPDENLEQFFPHRLGLSGVVEDQIRHFERLARKRRRVDRSQVEALLLLICRRPDAESVFGSAGRELARLRFRGPIGQVRKLNRHLPQWLQGRATARGLRAAHGNTLIANTLDISSSPLEMRMTGALTAAVESDSKACSLYTAMTAALAELNGAAAVQVEHTSCEAQGDEACQWSITI